MKFWFLILIVLIGAIYCSIGYTLVFTPTPLHIIRLVLWYLEVVILSIMLYHDYKLDTQK